jgi:hypothetical protein
LPTAIAANAIHDVVAGALQKIEFIDVHTHLFMPSLGKVGLWGIDELVTYHYLEAELFRSSSTTPAEYFALSRQAKADLIWQKLFVENAPVSEATRGVIAVLSAFGLPTAEDTLKTAREFFAQRELRSHIREVFRLAGISEVVMTNDPLDPEEAPLGSRGPSPTRNSTRCCGWTASSTNGRPTGRRLPRKATRWTSRGAASPRPRSAAS